MKKRVILGCLALAFGFFGVLSFFTTRERVAHAAGLIEVNSDSDTQTDDGVCTLREAIVAANTDAASGATPGECAAGSGTDTIEFNITGTADFVNNTQNGYTIRLTTGLPEINTPVVIDGYSQPGSAANNAVSPAPFNDTLLIEIDGENLPLDNTTFAPCLEINTEAANNSEVHGLVINDCGDHGIWLGGPDGVKIQGNYIGVDPTGLIDKGNGRDFTTVSIAHGVSGYATDGTVIGGVSPEHRNIIAGNQAGDIFLGDETDTDVSQNNVIQGNYVGLAADGTTALPSGFNWGLGNAILFGHSFNDQIGGTATGAKNVIGSSLEYGVSFRDGCANSFVYGNYIGTDYTGNAPATVNFTNSIGTFTGSGHLGGAVHLGIVSNGNFTRPPNNISIGGAGTAMRNIISGNVYDDVNFSAPGVILHDGTYGNTVQGNYIGVGADGSTDVGNETDGVLIYQENSSAVENNLIGGQFAGEENIIAFNGGAGVRVNDTATNNPIIRNRIYSNGGLGIELGPFGKTQNDSGDSDSGANDLLNFPGYTLVTEAAGNTTVEYRVDLPAGDYRIEFYRNTAADPSGNGEGQFVIGNTNITSTGTGWQSFSYTLGGVTGVTNLAMTATERNLATPSTFGSTSEFGGTAVIIQDLSIAKTLLNPTDVANGATLNYQITVTNEGLDAIDISGFDNSNPGVNGIFLDLLPAELSYDSVVSGDVSCLSFGVGSASLFGPLLANHSDGEIMSCGYTGADPTLSAGETLVVVLGITVDQESDLVFENIVIQQPNANDPDITTFGTAANSGNDLIDELGTSVNNIAYASYPLLLETADPTQGAGGDSLLAQSGENLWKIIAVALTLMVAGLGIYLRRRALS